MRHYLPKLFALLGIFLLLWLMLQYVTGIVQGRTSYRNQAVQSITQGSAGAQHIAGPLLLRQCTEQWSARIDGKPQAFKREFQLLDAPLHSSIKASTDLQPRYRGIFKANTWQGKFTLHAQWGQIATPQAANTGGQVVCKAPQMVISVSDARGLMNATLKLQEQKYAFKPGTGLPNAPRGIHTELPAEFGQVPGLQAEVLLQLAGAQSLALVPLAENNAFTMQSNWQHPAFDGRLLPTARTVNKNGFDAEWNISSLASSAFEDFARGAEICDLRQDVQAEEFAERAAAYAATVAAETAVDAAAAPAVLPQSTYSHANTRELTANGKGCVDAVGVRFIEPVDPYTLSDRASKYGLLFVVLTFVAVAMVEVLQSLRVHPVQYLLVGSALVIFFLLLVSLSEHLGFNTAYSIASTACVLLLTYYASGILGGFKRGLVFGAGIALLYGLLYVLLQLEQTALLAGSIALFAVLASIMLLTRKIDWYSQLGSLPLRRSAAQAE